MLSDDDEIPDAELADRLGAMSRSERARDLYGFDAWDFQREWLDAPEHADGDRAQVSIVAGRQVGKTRTAALIPADAALLSPNTDALIVARYAATADELFRETKRHLRNTGLSDAEIGITTPNKTEFELDTGSRIMARTTGPDGAGLRGLSPDVIVAEEAALIGDQVYERVIEPMLAAKDSYEFYLVSTPRGKSGYLYRKHVHADAWRSFSVPTSASPLVSEQWLADKRESVDAITWRTEYLGEFAESSEAYLPYSVVDPCVVVPIGEHVPRPGRRWLGVDPARGGADRSAYVSVSEHGHARIEAVVDRETVPETVGRIEALDREHGPYEAILIDENAVGGGTVDFASLSIDSIRPFTFSGKSRQALYQTLKRVLESGAIALPNDRQLIDELTALEYSFSAHGILKVAHPSGGHDDLSDALALAVTGWQRSEQSGARRRDRDETPGPVYTSPRDRSRFGFGFRSRSRSRSGSRFRSRSRSRSRRRDRSTTVLTRSGSR